MCGRFTLRTSPEELAEHFDLSEIPQLPPRYNVAPSQEVLAVRASGDEQRKLVSLRWGLIPFWADDPKIGQRLINARAETVATKPAFREAFQRRRCLVVADGFYEWRREGGKKQPYYIRLRDDQPIGFAGLWERWKHEGQTIQSCCIIVTDANDVVRPIHDRMPVILDPDDYGSWLAPDNLDSSQLRSLLRPYDGQPMVAYAVNPLVNSADNDSAACLDAPPKQNLLF